MTRAGLGCIAMVCSISACFLFAGRDSARLQAPPDSPVEVRLGCALAETRCTRCHTVDRILSSSLSSVEHWRSYVHRMRLQPQSGILPDEELPILRCLAYRSFGRAGLDSVESAP
jgi:hypothetical protein